MLLAVSCLAYSLTLKMAAVHSSEMLVDFYQTLLHYIPEGSTLQHYDESKQVME
jgi:hypothetical protein